MDERENLPIVLTTQAVTLQTEKRSSLIWRGLVALEKKNDALYCQAREIYNRLTGDGSDRWFGCKELEQSLTEAFNTFQQLARVGYGKAYFPLSTLHSGEQSVKGDPAQAEQFHKLALDWLHTNEHLNDPKIWQDLGVLYEGNDVELAIHWFQKAADAGNASSMWGLVGAYEHKEDWENALAWQIEAAIAGHGKAQRGLEQQHERGDLESKIGYAEIFNWYLWSAEQGHLWAQLSLAKYYCSASSEDVHRSLCSLSILCSLFHPADDLENQEQVVRWLHKAAEQGDARGQWLLGDMHRTGRGVAQNYVQAEYWYCKAAEQGDSRYQNKLGQIYRSGLSISQDDRQAVYWFTKAAEQEHADGQFNLGFMYDKGRGVAQDDEQAVYWFRKAAEQDVPWAQVRLAIRYRNGVGIASDINLSKYWFLKAASNTATSARARLAQKHAKKSLASLDKLETNKESP